MDMTTSRTAMVTICGTQSTRPNFATNLVGSQGVSISRKACRQRSNGIATTRTGGRPPKTPPNRSTLDADSSGKPGNDGVRDDFGRREHADTGTANLAAARSRRQPWVVQGELAAHKDGGRRNAGFRS